MGTVACDRVRQGKESGRWFPAAVLVVVTALAILSPAVTAAATATESTAPPIKLQVPIPNFSGADYATVKDFSEYLMRFYVFFVGAAGILAVIMIMYGGYQWLSAAGNSSRIQSAQTTMNGAVVGLVLLLASYLLLRLINPELVNLNPSVLGEPIVRQRLSPYCTPDERVEKDGVEVPVGQRTCGEPYTIINGNGRFCYGVDCAAAQACGPAGGGYRCQSFKDACEAAKDRDHCLFVDRQLSTKSAADGNACRSGYEGGSPKTCVYTPIIQTNYARVDCDVGGPSRPTACWRDGRAASQETPPPYTRWCAQKTDTRPGTKTDTICTIFAFRCQQNSPGAEYLDVDCTTIQRGDCAAPNKCWIWLNLTS